MIKRSLSMVNCVPIFQVLMDMFEQDELMLDHPVEETSTNQTYSEVLKDLIMDEKQYLRDLQVRLI